MKTKILLIVAALALLLFLPLVCQARIGETLDQCVQRYGKPVPKPIQIDNDDSYLFQKDGYSIIVSFLQGRAYGITYGRRGKTPLREDEITNFLQKNGGSRKWLKASSDNTPLIGSLIASNSNGGNMEWFPNLDGMAWCTDDYALYACCSSGIPGTAACLTIYNIKNNQQALAEKKVKTKELTTKKLQRF